ncbi:MAG: hotdog fold thioesterase [Balneolaceae bacterium]|nr:hotdog fold thioesterase [Balneolaceae bacterium]
MFIDQDIKEKVKQFLNLSDPNMVDNLGIEFESFKPDEIEASMPVDERTVQPFGILHGGASVTLAETLASVGAWLNVEDDAKTTVGVEINANHIRSVKKGNSVKGIATPIHTGENIHVWEVRIETESGKLVCSSRCTLAVVNKG